MRYTIIIITTVLLAIFAGACTKTSAPAITVENGRLRLPAPGQTIGAAYFDIVNTGSADTLLSVSGSLSKDIELHTHLHENGIMKMRKVDNVEIKAKQTTVFKSGGLHVMIFNMKPLVKGAHIPLTLHFSKSGDVVVNLSVGMNADAMDHGKIKH
ncbi:MAG: copper chaperone PCu(A)C [Robiginitomaculum sp.]